MPLFLLKGDKLIKRNSFAPGQVKITSFFLRSIASSSSYLSCAGARRHRPITSTQSSPHLHTYSFNLILSSSCQPKPERSLLAGGVLGEVAQTTHRHCAVSCALVGLGWRNGTGGSWRRACPDIHGQRASVPAHHCHQLIKVNLQRHQTFKRDSDWSSYQGGSPDRPTACCWWP